LRNRLPRLPKDLSKGLFKGLRKATRAGKLASATTPPDDKVVAWFPIAGSLQVEPCNGGRSSYVFRMTYAADAAGSGFDNGKL
jgi:hypothetical protein